MPAKRRGKAVTIPSSPAFTFGSSRKPRSAAGAAAATLFGSLQALSSHPVTRSACRSVQHFERLWHRFICFLTCLGTAVRSSTVGTVQLAPVCGHAEGNPGPGAYNIHSGIEIVEAGKDGLRGRSRQPSRQGAPLGASLCPPPSPVDSTASRGHRHLSRERMPHPHANCQHCTHSEG